MRSNAGTVRSFSFLFPVLLLSFFVAADCAPLAAQTQPVQDASPASPQNPRALSRLPDMTVRGDPSNCEDLRTSTQAANP
jgi:hypothetical protein